MNERAFGITDQQFDLKTAGYLSTTEVVRRIGVGLNRAQIVQDFGISPRLVLNGGKAVYWAPEQVSEIRRNLVMKLLREEWAS